MIIFLGIQGTGKSTQADLLAERLGVPKASTGDMLRANMTGEAVKEMLAGKILDDDHVLPLLDKAFKTVEADEKELVFEGSPRTMRQVEWFVDKARKGEIKITAVVHLLADKEVVKKRLLGRGRSDDTDAAIEQRFKEYESVITPIINYLRDNGIKVYDVNAGGSVEEVAENIRKTLGL